MTTTATASIPAPGMGSGDPRAALALIEAGLEMLAESDFTAVGGTEEQIALGDRILAVERRLAPAVFGVVRLLGRFGVAKELKFRNLSALLQRTYRMTQHEAWTVIREADLYAADRALTGEVLAPARPEVAAGMAEGVLSRAQARVIEDALQAIPGSHVHPTRRGRSTPRRGRSDVVGG